MLTTIFETIGEVISNFFDVLSTALSSVVEIFYTAGAAGAPGQLTFLGILTLIGVGVGLVWTVFKLVKSSIQMRG